jgi:hypothetical protein
MAIDNRFKELLTQAYKNVAAEENRRNQSRAVIVEFKDSDINKLMKFFGGLKTKERKELISECGDPNFLHALAVRFVKEDYKKHAELIDLVETLKEAIQPYTTEIKNAIIDCLEKAPRAAAPARATVSSVVTSQTPSTKSMPEKEPENKFGRKA